MFSFLVVVPNSCMGVGNCKGHYITLVGYRSRSHLFVYRNPAVHQDYCLTSPEQLDIARRVKGTDHDW